MEHIWLRGDLEDLHFGHLLARIWKSGGTGPLEITKEDAEKRLIFHKGGIAVTKDNIEKKSFLEFLNKKITRPKTSQEKINGDTFSDKRSFLSELIEQGWLSPRNLWNSILEYQKEALFPVFDWSRAEYFFDPEKPVREYEILAQIDTPLFILQGIRQMKNDALVLSLSPGEDREMRKLLSDGAAQPLLEPFEKYVLALVETYKTAKKICGASVLGQRETRKALFGFLSLGIVGFPEKSRSSHPPSEISKSEIFRIMELFNEKGSYIFKYISKEIGPVALNILEKGLEDTKPLLSPLFAGIRLGPDGKIEANAIIKSGIALSGEEIKGQLLHGLNEILVALVFAVRKTLGNEHEKLLVKNLKKIGE